MNLEWRLRQKEILKNRKRKAKNSPKQFLYTKLSEATNLGVEVINSY